jgi:hypothetical protein
MTPLTFAPTRESPFQHQTDTAASICIGIYRMMKVIVAGIVHFYNISRKESNNCGFIVDSIRL